MKDSIKDLLHELSGRLAKHKDIDDPLRRFSSCIEEVRKTLAGLPQVAESEMSTEDQILHNKELLAPLYGKYIFFQSCYKLEYQKRHSVPEQMKDFIREELTIIREFFQARARFCQYYLSGATDQDQHFFTTDNKEPSPIDNESFTIPTDINCGCLLKACILAYNFYSKLLRKNLESQETNLSLLEATFNYNDIDIVEEMRGKYVSKSISVRGKPATRKYIIKMLERLYGRKVPNWEQLYQSITERKKEKFAYHTQILTALNQDLDRLEGKAPQN
jgi:hypothetical protein